MRQRFADAANQLSHRIASVEAKIGLAEGSLDVGHAVALGDGSGS